MSLMQGVILASTNQKRVSPLTLLVRLRLFLRSLLSKTGLVARTFFFTYIIESIYSFYVLN